MGSQLRGHNVPWRCKAGDCDGGGGPRPIDLEDSGKESCHSESHNAAPADVWGHSARPLLLLLLLSAENLLSSTWLMFLSLASTSPRHQKVPRDRAKEGRYPLV